MQTIQDAQRALQSGATSARALTERCLAAVKSEGGEGPRTFVKINEAAALARADEIDALRRRGAELPPFAGIPISIKDLFDVQGEVTTAGSVVLKNEAPATADAAAVARLRAAGFIMIGRTNMTEFAYSGVGLNPHYGTPKNPYERSRGRIPGGSSSRYGAFDWSVVRSGGAQDRRTRPSWQSQHAYAGRGLLETFAGPVSTERSGPDRAICRRSPPCAGVRAARHNHGILTRG